MSKKASSAALALVAAGLLCSASAPVVAQWLNYPTANVPRTRDGKPSLTAPAPRTRDGKPDFSGMWLTADGLPCATVAGQEFLECGSELPISRYGINMGAGMPGGLPYQPWAAQQVKTQTEQNSRTIRMPAACLTRSCVCTACRTCRSSSRRPASS